MASYILRRVLLIFPTLLGVMIINFAIIQLAPGGPVEQAISKLKGHNIDVTARLSGNFGNEVASGKEKKYINPEILNEIKALYGFDKPAPVRFFDMMVRYLRFDFGHSFFRDETVLSLIVEKMPVSISLGLWTTLLVYLISIPLGIRKAVRDGSQFDIWSSSLIIAGNAIPSFLFAIMLIVFFAGGRYLDIFPLRGLVSDNWETLSFSQKIADYFWHLTLPLISLVIGGFAGLTLLTKNSFLDHISQQYVLTARAKGLDERSVLYRHIFRNAMLIIIAGFPGAFIGIFFTSSAFIEIIFSLDGLGLLTYEAVIGRDYPVFFATLYVFSLLGLFMGIVNDLMYHWIDPRIHFESHEGR